MVARPSRALGPDNPDHQSWVDEWLRIRDEVLNETTNHYFFEQYPAAPAHLDPDDTDQVGYVAEWLRIRDELLGDGVTQAQSAADPAPVVSAPPLNEFDQAAATVTEELRSLHEISRLSPDSDAARHVAYWLDIGRSMYQGRHFDHHDEWTSSTADFDIGPGCMSFGIQIRVVGSSRSPRIGLVGSGPSDVGGWQNYNGAPTY